MEAVAAADPLRTAGSTVIGVYTDDEYRTAAIVAMEAPLAARIAAAFALIAPRRIEERIAGGALWVDQFEDVSEVLNILAAMLNADGAPHVRLSTVYDALRTFPPMDVVAWLSSYLPRVDVDVTVKGYGSGTMTVIVAGA
ncbi:hypothetical protein [Georgenia sp. SYP-B2076]|uniref:hypothetical protein n=1 Tax=Georgenia sp. SYP-B2076 TaxID=2495881 RepID=UPI000F8DD433|nr:hypothetical protein [Georgenia sp. SYP-B2076]